MRLRGYSSFRFFLIAIWGYGFYTLLDTQVIFSVSRIVALLKDSFQMAAIGTIRLIYERITATLLPGLVGLSATCIFSIAFRLVSSGKLGYFSAFTAMYPVMARNVEIGRKMKGLGLLIGTSVVFSLLLYVFANPIISLLFGDEFLTAVPSLQIMAWSTIPYVLITYLTLSLAALGMEKPIFISSIFALITLLVLLFVLTNRFGIAGASFAILGAEFFCATFLWLQWRKYVLSKFP